MLWRDLFQQANEFDPEHRAKRVHLMSRLLSGMAQTEGRSTAYRLVRATVAEAATHSTALGASVAAEALSAGLVAWPDLIDAQFRGIIARNAKLALPLLKIWLHVVLPYLSVPYYDKSPRSAFIGAAIAALPQDELSSSLTLSQQAVEELSEIENRAYYLIAIAGACQARTMPVPANLDEAILRWTPETLAANRESCATDPDQYEAIVDLGMLTQAVASKPAGADYQFERALCRILPVTLYADAERFIRDNSKLLSSRRVQQAMVDSAVASGCLDDARKLLGDTNFALHSDASWDEFMGGGKLPYYSTLVKLDGNAARSLAFNHFVEDVSHGRQSVSSVLPELVEIFSIISAAPDWAALWSVLDEQLRTSRDFNLAQPTPTQPATSVSTDEEIIADLLLMGVSSGLYGLAFQIRRVFGGLFASLGGQQIGFHLIDRLLGGGGASLHEAMTLLELAAAEPSVSDRYRKRLVDLAQCSDIAVVGAVVRLAAKWQADLPSATTKLLSFYSLKLPNEEEGADFGLPPISQKPASGLLLVAPLDWTAFHEAAVDMISKASGQSQLHIRLRAAQLIQSWGGLGKFGPQAEDSLRQRYRSLKLQLPYMRPALEVGLRALRHVAGELHLAKTLNSDACNAIEHYLMTADAKEATIATHPRPSFLSPMDFPTSSSASENAEWVSDLDNAGFSMPQYPTTVIAAMTSHHVSGISRNGSQHVLTGVGLPTTDAASFDEMRVRFPRAIMHRGFMPLYDKPSSSFVCRVVSSNTPCGLPTPLSFCPFWAKRIGWKFEGFPSLRFHSSGGELMAETIVWRDGLPRDIDEPFQFGAGTLVQLSVGGMAQLVSVAGRIVPVTFVWRNAGKKTGISRMRHSKMKGSLTA
jgi:hypothetical protein